MYHPLNSWKTHLCKLDCESLFVSWALPCHVYAKLRKGSYAFHLVVYLCMWMCAQLLYSCTYYLNSHACPLYETDMCVLLDESECSKHYMKVDSEVAPCVYRDTLCTYEPYECIPPKKYLHLHLFIFPSTLLVYIFLVNLHCILRKEMQATHGIQRDCTDCLAVTCCSTCGLAQEYREV
jgi:Cys-rich protein (TIGR01571 family)